jgi:hypothetical protein
MRTFVVANEQALSKIRGNSRKIHDFSDGTNMALK